MQAVGEQPVDPNRTTVIAPDPKVAPPEAKPSAGHPIDAKAWLQCDPLPPVPVGHKPVVRLGRSRDCDLVLPHESVSRVHAEIRSLGIQLVIEDRSTYGTTVNGKRIVSHELEPGDLISVGPYQITVRETRAQRSMDAATTKPFRLQAKSAEAMQGRLDKVSLSEIFQQIELNRKTGTLKVFDDEAEETGVLVTYEGRPMYAEMGELKDEEALMCMLRLASGSYSFLSKVEAGDATMEGKRSLTGILLEVGRQMDESSQ